MEARLWKSVAKWGLVGLASSGCGDDFGLPEQTPVPVADLFRTLNKEVRFEENDSVINVAPAVDLVGTEFFIVADAQEAQVRLYERSGRLVRVFGQRGNGPGELQVPVSAVVQGATPRVTVLDLSRGIQHFDFLSSESRGQIPSPFRIPYRAVPMGDDQLLVFGRLSPVMVPDLSLEAEYSLLHRFDPATGELLQSWFELPEDDGYGDVLAMSFGGGDFSVREDTVAAVFALSDSLFIATLAGEVVPSFRLPIPSPLPSDVNELRTNDPRERLRLRAAMSRLNFLHWLPDGRFLIQTVRRAAEDEWRSYLIARDGQLIAWTDEAPRVARAWSDTVAFASPSGTAPDRMTLAIVK